MYRRLFILFAAVLLAASCESEVREANVNQEKYIDDYIQAYFADSTVVHIDGITRVLMTDNPYPAPVVEKGDSVLVFYVGYTFAEGGPASRFIQDSATVRIGSGDIIRGLDSGLQGMKQGQEALLLFPSQYGYGTSAVGLVPENTALYFDVTVPLINKKN